MRIKTLLFAALLLLTSVRSAFASVGDKFVVGELQYTVLGEDFTVSVSHIDNDYSLSGALTIPATVENDGTTYTVTNLPGDAFSYCDNLTSISIPSTVTTIAPNAFYIAPGLTELTVDENNMAYCAVDGILYDKAVTQIIRCPQQKSGVVELPQTITSIGNYSFVGCSKITAVNIPDGLTLIGERAFLYCSSLTSITIPANTVLDSNNYSPFGACTSLTKINITDGNTSAKVADDFLLSYDGTKIFYSLSRAEQIQIPDQIKALAGYSFAGSPITSITIPKNVVSLTQQTFSYCQNLTSIDVDAENSTFESVDGVLFNKTKKLYAYPGGRTGEYVIPDDTQEIVNGAFMGSSVSAIVIPNSVKTIRSSAFTDAGNLKKITFKSSTPPSGMSYVCFYGTPNNLMIVVPDGSKEAFQTEMPYLKDHIFDESGAAAIVEVAVDSEEAIDYTQPIEVFDLSGKKVATNIKSVKAGIYIIKQNDKSAKVAVK